MDKAQVLNRVYEYNLPSRVKTVMFYLVNRSNKELTCFPAIPTIARETGLSERTVQRALKELVEERFIEKNSRYRENGGQSSNLYRLDIKNDSQSDESLKEVIDSELQVGVTVDISGQKGFNLKELESIDFFSFYNTAIFNHNGTGWATRVFPHRTI